MREHVRCVYVPWTDVESNTTTTPMPERKRPEEEEWKKRQKKEPKRETRKKYIARARLEKPSEGKLCVDESDVNQVTAAAAAAAKKLNERSAHTHMSTGTSPINYFMRMNYTFFCVCVLGSHCWLADCSTLSHRGCYRIWFFARLFFRMGMYSNCADHK